jgi:bacterioferritin
MKRAYTPISKATPQPHTVRLLRNLYTGPAGESNAILQYVNHAYLLEESKGDIAKALMDVAGQEMTHQRCIGRAIVSFGGRPGYNNGRSYPNDFAFIDQSKAAADMLHADILAEERAIRDYERAIERVQNLSLIQLLSEILTDEREHLRIFRELRAAL